MRSSYLVFVLTFSLVLASLFSIHFSLISKNEISIDPAFSSYYHSFLSEGSKRGFHNLNKINIKMGFKPLSESVSASHLNFKEKVEIGHCKVIIGQDPVILIDPILWKKYSVLEREMIIFHELAHCFLLKGHTEAHGENIPSLMNSSIFYPGTYLAHREKYINELFSYKPYHIKDYLYTFFISPTIDNMKAKYEKITHYIASL